MTSVSALVRRSSIVLTGCLVTVVTPVHGRLRSKNRKGPGVEVVLNRAGRVIALRERRGGTIPPKGNVLAATGDEANNAAFRFESTSCCGSS